MTMSQTGTHFTDALDAFDPGAEPYASMSKRQLTEARDERIKAKDLFGYWTAKLHILSRTTPLERLTSLTQSAVHGRLRAMEREGKLPYGWTPQHLVAIYTIVRAGVKSSKVRKKRLASLSMFEVALAADIAAEDIAADMAANREMVERYASDRQIPLLDHPSKWN